MGRLKWPVAVGIHPCREKAEQTRARSPTDLIVLGLQAIFADAALRFLNRITLQILECHVTRRNN
jgi:hypothetical protein